MLSKRYRTRSFTIVLLVHRHGGDARGRHISPAARRLQGRFTAALEKSGCRDLVVRKRKSALREARPGGKPRIHRHWLTAVSPCSWHTKQGRGFRRNCVAQPPTKPFLCGS